jgi:hypothetical protein
MVISKLNGKFILDGYTNDSCWQLIQPLPFFAYLPVWGQPMTENGT